MIKESEQTDIKLVLIGVGMLIGCIFAVLAGCSGAARDAGVDVVQTSSVATSSTSTLAR